MNQCLTISEFFLIMGGYLGLTFSFIILVACVLLLMKGNPNLLLKKDKAE